jgi:hypothetical protein
MEVTCVNEPAPSTQVTEPTAIMARPVVARPDDAETPRRIPLARRLRPKPLREWSETGQGVAAALAIFLLSRIVAILVGYLLVVLSPRSTLLEVLSLWDGEFYVRIATGG